MLKMFVIRRLHEGGVGWGYLSVSIDPYLFRKELLLRFGAL
jgi:hypothetical protein